MTKYKFREDDPFYYKQAIGELLLKAEKEGLKLQIECIGAEPKEVAMTFANTAGEKAVLPLY